MGFIACLALPKTTPGTFGWKVPLPRERGAPFAGLRCCTAPSALLGEQRVMKSGVSVRKPEEKGGANGLRPCWGAWVGNGAGKPPGGQREAALGVQGPAGGHPQRSPSLGLWEAAPATLAWSQGSFLLQEKLCLPAVRSLMPQILCKTACFKERTLGEAALQVWPRSFEVAGALQNSRDADYAKIHTLAYLQL